jgi:hypothetical protein
LNNSEKSSSFSFSLFLSFSPFLSSCCERRKRRPFVGLEGNVGEGLRGVDVEVVVIVVIGVEAVVVAFVVEADPGLFGKMRPNKSSKSLSVEFFSPLS